MNCQQFSTISNSYIGDELLVETNHEILRHLENCHLCRHELAAKREWRKRFRAAVINDRQAKPDPIFIRRLEANLHRTAMRLTLWEKFKVGNFINFPGIATVIATCLLVSVLLGERFGQFNLPSIVLAGQESQATNSGKISQSAESDSPQIVKVDLREIASAAVSDHENCAVHFHLKETPISLERAAEKYGQFNRNLDKTVMAALQSARFAGNESGKPIGKIELHNAHSCVFEGRRFTHIILQNGKRTISILVAETELDNENGDAITNQPGEKLQTASFLAARHAVFVISDLSEPENMTVARTIAPAIRRHIEQS